MNAVPDSYVCPTCGQPLTRRTSGICRHCRQPFVVKRERDGKVTVLTLQAQEEKPVVRFDCPTCGDPLTRTTNGVCRSCGELFFIRRQHGQMIILSSGADQARQQARLYTSHRNRILTRLRRMKVADARFDALDRKMTRRLGGRPSPTAVFWQLAPWWTAAAIRREDWQAAARGLKEMSSQAWVDGEPWVRLSRSAYEATVKWYGQWMAPDSVLRAIGCSCRKCAVVSPVLFTLDEAVREERLPHVDCETPPCRCYPHIETLGGERRGITMGGPGDDFVMKIDARFFTA